MATTGFSGVLDAIKNVQSILDDGQENLDGGTHLQLCTATKEAFQQVEALRDSVAAEGDNPLPPRRLTANEAVEHVKDGRIQYQELGRVLFGDSAITTKSCAMYAVKLLVENHEDRYWQTSIDDRIVGGLLCLAHGRRDEDHVRLAVQAIGVLRILTQWAGDREFKTKLVAAGCMWTISHIMAEDGQTVNLIDSALDLLVDLVTNHEGNKAMATALGYVPMLVSCLKSDNPILMRISGARALHQLLENNKVNCMAANEGGGAVKWLVELLDADVRQSFSAKPIFDVLMQLAVHVGPKMHVAACASHGAMTLLARIITNTCPNDDDKACALHLIAFMCPSGVEFAGELHQVRMAIETFALLRHSSSHKVQHAAAMALGSYAMHAGYLHTGSEPDPFPHVGVFRQHLYKAIPTLVDLAGSSEDEPRAIACVRALANFSAINRTFCDEIAHRNGVFALTTIMGKQCERTDAAAKRGYAKVALENMAIGYKEPHAHKRRRCMLADWQDRDASQVLLGLESP